MYQFRMCQERNGDCKKDVLYLTCCKQHCVLISVKTSSGSTASFLKEGEKGMSYVESRCILLMLHKKEDDFFVSISYRA